MVLGVHLANNINPKNLLKGKALPVHEAENLTAICELTV
jgi:hypothetical protein